LEKRKLTKREVIEWIADKDYKTFHWKEVLDGLYPSYLAGHVRAYLSELKREGFIKSIGSRQGNYKQIEDQLPPINWWEGEAVGLPLVLPLQLHELCFFFPPCLIVVAGSPNTGKTAFLMNVAKMNCDWIETRLFISEGIELLKNRFKGFYPPIHIPPNFTTHPMPIDPVDAIKPDILNVLDYIEPNTDAVYRIADTLKEITEKLGQKGIAVVALQKPFGRDTAYGGSFTLFKPSLYLAIDKNKMRIIRMKVPKIIPDEPLRDVYRMTIQFRIHRGVQFEEMGRIVE